MSIMYRLRLAPLYTATYEQVSYDTHPSLNVIATAAASFHLDRYPIWASSKSNSRIHVHRVLRQKATRAKLSS